MIVHWKHVAVQYRPRAALFINEHPTASRRCRSDSLKISAADHMQSSWYFQTGCVADSCTLECVWAAWWRGDTCTSGTQVKSRLPSWYFPWGFPIASAAHSSSPSPLLSWTQGALLNGCFSRSLLSLHLSRRQSAPHNWACLITRESSGCKKKAFAPFALPSPLQLPPASQAIRRAARPNEGPQPSRGPGLSWHHHQWMVDGGGTRPVPASPVKAAGVSRGSARERDDGRDRQVWARGRAARRRESQPLGAWASEDARRSSGRGGGGAAQE